MLDGKIYKSRQSIDTNLTLYTVKFVHNNYLNYQGGIGSANWDWAVGKLYSGNVGLDASYKRSEYASYTLVNDKISRIKEKFGIKRPLNIYTHLSFDASLQQTRHSLTELKRANSQILSFKTGLNLENKARSALNSFIGLKLIKYPDRTRNTFLDNQATMYRIGIAGIVYPRVYTQINAQLGFTYRHNNYVKSRDFNGITGHLIMSWSPREKFRTKVQLIRDVLTSAYFVANYYEVYKLKAINEYNLTSKMQLFVNYSLARHIFNSDQLVSAWIENLRSLDVGVAYVYSQNVNVKLLNRNLSRGSTIPERVYQSNQYSLDVTLYL